MQAVRRRMSSNRSTIGSTSTHSDLNRSVQILLDTLAIEDVPASCLDRIFCDVVAQSTDSRFATIVCEERPCIVLAPQDKIGVASHLPHTSETASVLSQVQE